MGLDARLPGQFGSLLLSGATIRPCGWCSGTLSVMLCTLCGFGSMLFLTSVLGSSILVQISDHQVS